MPRRCEVCLKRHAPYPGVVRAAHRALGGPDELVRKQPDRWRPEYRPRKGTFDAALPPLRPVWGRKGTLRGDGTPRVPTNGGFWRALPRAKPAPRGGFTRTRWAPPAPPPAPKWPEKKPE